MVQSRVNCFWHSSKASSSSLPLPHPCLRLKSLLNLINLSAPFRTFFASLSTQQTVAHDSLIKFDYLHSAQKYPRHFSLFLFPIWGGRARSEQHIVSSGECLSRIRQQTRKDPFRPPTVYAKGHVLSTPRLLSLEHRDFSTSASWKKLSPWKSSAVFIGVLLCSDVEIRDRAFGS
jgi:hypothetical protein